MLTISIVSHGHGALLAQLLRDLGTVVRTPFQVVLTLNIPEPELAEFCVAPYPLQLIRNPQPRGFGANHNAALRLAGPGTFCVINPDVRLTADPFPALLAALADPRAAIVAPMIADAAGRIESNARRFPTPLSILRKALLGAPAAEYEFGSAPLAVDWVSGVFLVVGSQAYSQLGGFDERYFLYYEDVDLCARARALGHEVLLVPGAQAMHAARRDSHRKLRYMRWHLASMGRFFLTRY